MAQLSPAEARRVLGVTASSDVETVKRRYRRLVQQHHPDRGGDVERFRQIQAAFELLVTIAPARRLVLPADAIAATRTGTDAREIDLGSIDWHRSLPTGRTALDRDLLALLAAAPEPGPLAAFSARSRKPGGAANRLLGVLDDSLSSSLEVGAATRGDEVLVRFVFRQRHARRRALAAKLPFGWVRDRANSDTFTADRWLPVHSDRRATAVRAADSVAAACDALGWPLESWFVEL